MYMSLWFCESYWANYQSEYLVAMMCKDGLGATETDLSVGLEDERYECYPNRA